MLTGNRRLHDLRSRSPYVAQFMDKVDTFSAIYSLLPFGREYFIAGGANHSLLKVFDFRIPSNKLCGTVNLDPGPSMSENIHYPSTSRSSKFNPSLVLMDRCDHKKNFEPRNWNIFLDNSLHPYNSRRKSSSPVYSLSSPSSCSPTFYAGLEDNVIQVDLTSIHGPHPDPIFTRGLGKTQDLSQNWDPEDDIMRLAAYEQTSGAVKLMIQAPGGQQGDCIGGLDERWRRTV